MRYLFVFLLISFSIQLKAQNLISNPGFENYTSIPVNYGEYYLANGWGNCNGLGTPDYFHILSPGLNYFGTNLAHTGDAMAGFCPYHGTLFGFREYLSTQLSSPMVVGQTYTISFWLASGINGGYGYGCNNVGVALSVNPLYQPNSDPILLTPQIEMGAIFYDTLWTFFTYQYTADSAYQNFAIGNFRYDGNTMVMQFGVPYNAVYYFVDDITVELSNQAPVAIFNAPNNICPGTCTGFTNLSLNATSYLWSFAGATPSTSTDVNPVNICYNTPGNYTVSLIATNAISSDTLTLNNYITVYPYPAPQGITQTGDTLFANQGGVTYQWYQDGNLIPGATDYFYVAMQSGNYNVVATDNNGCEVEAAIFDVIAGIKFEVSGLKFEVYPNPGSDWINVKSDLEMEMITIYNSIGEKVFVSTTGEKKVSIRSLSEGIYWIEISGRDQQIRKPFIKSVMN